MQKLVLWLLGVVIVANLGISIVGLDKKEPNVSAVASPDVMSPWIRVGGVTRYYARTTLNASTTACAIQAPVATSTLVQASVMVTTASSTATTWTFAKATTAFATTTYLDSFSLASGIQGVMASSATTTGLDIKQTMAPNTYFVVGVAGTVIADSTKLNGFCQAEFLVN